MRLLITGSMLGLFLSLAAFAIPPLGQPSLPIDTRCGLSVSNNMIDYGRQSRWQLQDASSGGNAVTPGKRSTQFNVTCPYSQAMRLTVRGDNAANGNVRYGERGNMKVRLSGAQLDGQDVQLVIISAQGTVISQPENLLLLQPGMQFAPLFNGHIASGKSFTARMEFEPILKEQDARVASRQISEAALTLELLH